MEKKMKKSNTKTKGRKIIPFVNKCDVLIVEDEKSIRDFIEKIIHSRFPKLRIQSANDGLEGLKKVKAFKPHIVWTGVKMPRMDGLEMIELIRQDPDRKNTKIIVCTGCYTMKDVKSRALELGVDRFFPKPFKIEEALSAIAACLL
jgi:two-component system cell cycle response regulator